jgi:hypothetical protein
MMVLSPTDAQRFIRGFSVVMLKVLGGPKRRFTGDLLPWLAKGREKLMKKPVLLEKAKTARGGAVL